MTNNDDIETNIANERTDLEEDVPPYSFWKRVHYIPKIKIFKDNNLDDVTEDVNEWLKTRPHDEFKIISFNIVIPTNSNLDYIIILYEEMED